MGLHSRARLASRMVFVSLLVLGNAPERLWASETWSPDESQGNNHECVPLGLETTEYFVEVTSSLPNHNGLTAFIEVRRVRPVYRTGRCRQRVRSAILVHGRTIDAISAFDVPYKDYSIMTAMANSGIDAFAYNQLGFGGSSHFSMDDPCNASLSTRSPGEREPLESAKRAAGAEPSR